MIIDILITNMVSWSIAVFVLTETLDEKTAESDGLTELAIPYLGSTQHA